MPKKIETQLDKITLRAVRAATTIFAADTRKWEKQAAESKGIEKYINKEIKKLEKKGIVPGELSKKELKKLREKLRSKIPKYSLKASDLTKRLYEQVFFLYYFMGLDSSLDDVNALKAQDIKDNAKNVPPPKGEITFTVWQSINWETIGFPEALRIFRDKRIISGPEFKAAEAAIKNTAFSVQRIDELNVIGVMNDSIVKAIENGTVFRDWVDIFLPEIFEKAGYKAAPGLTPWHLETIFRTNQASAYNAGRWDGFQADSYVIALKYLTVGDNRVRDEHIELNGFVALKGDPVWREIYPPNGYNCRCSTMPLSRYRMRQDEIELTAGEPDTKNVDPDFRDAAGLFNYRDRLAAVVKQG